MPLPQQVINQLSNERPETQGLLSGALLFAVGILAVTVLFYLGLLFIYQPYLNGSLASVQGKIATVAQSVTLSDQAQLIDFSSQIVNVRSLLQNHVVFSNFLTWLAANTEANISYNQFSFSTGGDITIGGTATSMADVDQQVAIFESSPVVQKFEISSIGTNPGNNSRTFSMTMAVDPSLLSASGVTTNTTP